TMNSSLVVHVRQEGDTSPPDPYPLSHKQGVLRVFEGPDHLNPRFGPPSALLIAELEQAAWR
ncbi:MAG: hypothetical protein ACRD2X_20225, partial [Vicinamibacteraceae bacterium]